MPELPDVEVYRQALADRLIGVLLNRLIIPSPSLLRTFEPGPEDLIGKAVSDVSRIGKRIVLCFEGQIYCIIHLMISGRLRWHDDRSPKPTKIVAAQFDFDTGRLVDHGSWHSEESLNAHHLRRAPPRSI